MKDQQPPRGRPRKEGIDRFNVATDLAETKSFIRFRRAIGLSAKESFAVLIRFLNYVATNCAFQPQINPADADILAEYCWYDGEPAGLIAALQEAEFLDTEFNVNNWFRDQPLAEKIMKGRDLSSDKSTNSAFSDKVITPKIRQEKDKLNTIPPTPLPCPKKLEAECRSVPEQKKSNGKTRSMHDVLLNLQHGNSTCTQPRTDSQAICDEFCDKYGVHDTQTRAALLVRIQTCGTLLNLEVVRRMIGEIREDPNVQSPIKVLFFKLRTAIENVKKPLALEAA